MGVQGTRIYQRRRALEMSQEELAELVGTSQKQISKYEHGVNDATGDVLASLARALETTTDYLLGLTDDPSRQMRTSGDLNDDEKQLLEIFRQKSPEKRNQMLQVARVL